MSQLAGAERYLAEALQDQAPRRSLLVYRRNLLPFSETFIRQQLLAMREWSPVLIGSPIRDGLPLEGLRVEPVGLGRQAKYNRWKRRLRGLVLRRRSDPYENARREAAIVSTQPWFSRLQSLNPELLHVHFGTNAEEAWPLAIALGIPIVITLHGYDIATRAEWWESGAGGAKNRLYPRGLRAMAEHGATFIAVSDGIMERALEFGLPRAALRKILIGIDTSQFKPGPIAIRDRPPRILFVGRFVEKKGIGYLLDAFAGVQTRVPNAELILIGDGPLRAEMETHARKRLQKNVHFAGRMPSTQVRETMQQARVLCAPSVRAANGDSEGLPTVIFEAQASGLPVVTSALGGGTSEGIIDEVTGFACPERDVGALARGLIRVLTDDDFASSASMAARAFALDRLDISRHVDVLEDEYHQMTLQRPPQSLKEFRLREA